jgi:hypothetical protein
VTFTFSGFLSQQVISYIYRGPFKGGCNLGAVLWLSKVKLHSPAAWFRIAEVQFMIRDVTDPNDQYYVPTLSETGMKICNLYLITRVINWRSSDNYAEKFALLIILNFPCNLMDNFD